MFDRNTNMNDPASNHWRSSRVPLLCWNAAEDDVSAEEELDMEALHVADYGVAVIATVKTEEAAPTLLGTLKRGFDSVANVNVAAKWIVDIGCTHDMLRQIGITPHNGCLFRDMAIVFNTANGGACAGDEVPCYNAPSRLQSICLHY